MEPISITDLLKAVQGELIAGSGRAEIKAIGTDTRCMSPGETFIALKGENYDGHRFVKEALARGSQGIIISDPEAASGIQNQMRQDQFLVKVKDTTLALGKIGRFCRNRYDMPVVAITGSNGKTTTKDMLASILGQERRVVKSEANFNNQIGVPLTLFKISKETEGVVLELGTNHPGEIAYLAEMSSPSHGIITNIGEAHLEYFKTKEGVAKAKAELLENLGGEGTAILNGDDHYLARMAKDFQGRLITFGFEEGNWIRAVDIREYPGKVEGKLIGPVEIEISLPLPGRHNIYNALGAAAAGLILGIKPESVKEGLAGASLAKYRMEILELGSVIVIGDCYNANPSSMRVAIDTLVGLPRRGRKVLVMGDMLELGGDGEMLHRQIGRYLVAAGCDFLVTVGELAAIAAGEAVAVGMKAKNVLSLSCNEEATDRLQKILKDDDTVLIKGSRKIKMEEILTALKK
ncbi:MAG: UDP-N-acetylmuramoyl-tripeptide--D-alanyl-D-alanine ligase [bacterium]|nr:UDP-N-acetylmuramoyl-tripeptide--D-alanyl-D-alanine ligase [bacterium]